MRDEPFVSTAIPLLNNHVATLSNRITLPEVKAKTKFRYEGIWVPVITPFKNGQIDVAALKSLVASLVNSGVHGLVACGTTGEAAHLSEEEQETVLKTLLESVTPDYPVMVGISGSDTLTVTKKVARFNHYNIAGFLVSAPSYVKPSQVGILLHFQAIADAATHPIILYNIASRTGVNIELSTLITLSSDPRFVAIKESSSNIHQTVDCINQTQLQVLSGDDSLMLHTLCAGGIGAISAAAHIRPDLYVDIYNLVRSGNYEQAREIFNKLLPLIRLLFLEPNPGPLKAILASQGHIDESLRLPMTPVSAGYKEKLLIALAQIDTEE